MRTFKTKSFARFAKRLELDDDDLLDVVERAEEGFIDADLGGGVIKQRVARKGGGRSRGFCTVILFRRGELAFFVYGFAKSDRENLRPNEVAAFQTLAGEYLTLDATGLEAVQSAGAIVEVKRQ